MVVRIRSDSKEVKISCTLALGVPVIAATPTITRARQETRDCFQKDTFFHYKVVLLQVLPFPLQVGQLEKIKLA